MVKEEKIVTNVFKFLFVLPDDQLVMDKQTCEFSNLAYPVNVTVHLLNWLLHLLQLKQSVTVVVLNSQIACKAMLHSLFIYLIHFAHRLVMIYCWYLL